MIHADEIKYLAKEQTKQWNALQALGQQFHVVMQATEKCLDKIEALEKKLEELKPKKEEKQNG